PNVIQIKKDNIIANYSFYRPRSDRIVSNIDNINQMKRFRSLYYRH
ncbi:LOW QUALITY PROTEIN: hypothetical protein HMPREF0102_02944, partial [Bacteroides sp. 2_1_22]